MTHHSFCYESYYWGFSVSICWNYILFF